MANRVVHFEIQADDIERAKKFYKEALGWKIEKYQGEIDPGMDYWMIMTGEKGTPGIDGGMYARPKEKGIYTYDCTVAVPDIDVAVEAVKSAGGQITQEKMELKGVGWFASCTDTEGNKFALMQPTDWKLE